MTADESPIRYNLLGEYDREPPDDFPLLHRPETPVAVCAMCGPDGGGLFMTARGWEARHEPSCPMRYVVRDAGGRSYLAPDSRGLPAERLRHRERGAFLDEISDGVR